MRYFYAIEDKKVYIDALIRQSREQSRYNRRKEIRVAGERKSEAGIRYGVRNCAGRHCECICSPALNQARVKGAINLTPVFPLLRSLWLRVPQVNSFQAPNHFSRHRYRILGRSRKRFASYHPFSYFISLAWHVCANKFLLYIENTFATRSTSST